MLVMCPYCQGSLVWGNFYDDDLPEGDFVRAVGTVTVDVFQGKDQNWYLGVSDGESIDDNPNKCEWISVGEPIHYCPNCGRKLD